MPHVDLTPTVRRLLEARRRCNTPDFEKALAELAGLIGEDAPAVDAVAVPRATLQRLLAAFDVTAQPPDVRCMDLWTAAGVLKEIEGVLQ